MKTVALLHADLSGGGVFRSLALALALRRAGCRVHVYGFQFQEKLRTQFPPDIPVTALPGWHFPGFPVQALRLIFKARADLLYAIKPKLASFGLALLARRVRRIPLLLDIDDLELSWAGGQHAKYEKDFFLFLRHFLIPNSPLSHPDHPFFTRKLENRIRTANAITVASSCLRNLYGGIYLPNGKDTDLFEPARFDAEESRRKFGLGNKKVILFPGSRRPHKGVEDLLKAIDIVNDPCIRLVLVGETPYDQYDSTLEAKWKKWIFRLPAAPQENMPEIISTAHIVAVPQRDTPTARAQMPLKLTDGMAMAKPVLATRVGDIPEILGNTGYLVDPDSPEQLAEKIKYIFDHYDEALEKGRLSRERCIQYYSLDVMAETLKQVINNLNSTSR
jgi:glycosyltransferase involved in cell wall biosynthesis